MLLAISNKMIIVKVKNVFIILKWHLRVFIIKHIHFLFHFLLSFNEFTILYFLLKK